MLKGFDCVEWAMIGMLDWDLTCVSIRSLVSQYLVDQGPF